MILATDHYARIYRKTMDAAICFLAHWELTYACNLRCGHCYVSARTARGPEVSCGKAKRILDELADLGCLHLTLSGGEILMREDFFAIAAYARKKHFALRLMTNATLIDEGVCGRLASLNPVSVETSVYAAAAGLHDAATGVTGSFARTLRALELLKKKGLRTVVKFLMMRRNLCEFEAVRDLAAGAGADFMFDFCVVGKDDGSRAPLTNRLTRKQIKEFFVKEGIAFTERDPDSAGLVCSAGLNNIFLTPHLDAYPCIGLKYKLGNARQESLAGIWRSPQAAFIRTMDVRRLTACRGCGHVRFCDRCPGIALAEDGDLFGPSGFDCLVAASAQEVSQEKGQMR